MSAPTEGNGKKLIIIGDSGVGKTCIISRFIKGTFDDNSLAGTVSYSSKKLEIPEIGESIIFDIWDTAGQERYRSLTKFFFLGAKMVVLVYDITRRDSFDSLKNNWYKDLKENGEPNVVMGIAGNKSDRYDDEEVSEQEAREFAKSIGAVFSLTSAEKNTGINELFKELGKKFLGSISGTVSSEKSKTEHKQENEEESKQNIKIDRKDVVKQNKDQKNKKKFC